MQDPHKPQGDIGDNLKMNRPVVAHAESIDGIDVEDIPKGYDFLASVYSFKCLDKQLILVRGDADKGLCWLVHARSIAETPDLWYNGRNENAQIYFRYGDNR